MTKKEIFKYGLQMILVVVITSVLFTKVVKIVKVDGYSMYPTLHDGDLAVVNSLFSNSQEIDRFDVVVLRCDKLDKNIVKRVIGLPGDKIVYQDDKLYINGNYYSEEYLDDNYIKEAKEKYQVDLFTDDFEISLNEDEIFVLGDNRLQSADSRTLGTFKYDDILGKKGLILYPFGNMNFID